MVDEEIYLCSTINDTITALLQPVISQLTTALSTIATLTSELQRQEGVIRSLQRKLKIPPPPKVSIPTASVQRLQWFLDGAEMGLMHADENEDHGEFFDDFDDVDDFDDFDDVDVFDDFDEHDGYEIEAIEVISFQEEADLPFVDDRDEVLSKEVVMFQQELEEGYMHTINGFDEPLNDAFETLWEFSEARYKDYDEDDFIESRRSMSKRQRARNLYLTAPRICRVPHEFPKDNKRIFLKAWVEEGLFEKLNLRNFMVKILRSDELPRIDLHSVRQEARRLAHRLKNMI